MEIKNEEHQYNADLVAGETIQIYLNGNPTPVEYTVNPGYIGKVTFNYQETKTV
jgi:hypothetical protein